MANWRSRVSGGCVHQHNAATPTAHFHGSHHHNNNSGWKQAVSPSLTARSKTMRLLRNAPACTCTSSPNNERFHMASQTNSARARTGKKYRRSRHLKPRRGTLPTADSALFPRELGRYMRVQETPRLMQLRLLIWKQPQRQQRPVCAYEQNERLQLEAKEGGMHAHGPPHAPHTGTRLRRAPPLHPFVPPTFPRRPQRKLVF